MFQGRLLGDLESLKGGLRELQVILKKFKGCFKAISMKIQESVKCVSRKYHNKTWSSVSNSSLSKAFALCQFRKLKL